MKKCIDCGKTIVSRAKKNFRCPSCSHLGKRNSMFGRTGTNCPSFKEGLTSKTYYCKICNLEITYVSALYGQGRCHSCGGKGHSHEPWNKGIPNSTGHRLIETNKDTIIKHHIYLKENSEETIKIPRSYVGTRSTPSHRLQPRK